MAHRFHSSIKGFLAFPPSSHPSPKNIPKSPHAQLDSHSLKLPNHCQNSEIFFFFSQQLIYKSEPHTLFTLICKSFEIKSLWEAKAPEHFFPS